MNQNKKMTMARRQVQKDIENKYSNKVQIKARLDELRGENKRTEADRKRERMMETQAQRLHEKTHDMALEHKRTGKVLTWTSTMDTTKKKVADNPFRAAITKNSFSPVTMTYDQRNLFKRRQEQLDQRIKKHFGYPEGPMALVQGLQKQTSNERVSNKINIEQLVKLKKGETYLETTMNFIRNQGTDHGLLLSKFAREQLRKEEILMLKKEIEIGKKAMEATAKKPSEQIYRYWRIKMRNIKTAIKAQKFAIQIPDVLEFIDSDQEEMEDIRRRVADEQQRLAQMNQIPLATVQSTTKMNRPLDLTTLSTEQQAPSKLQTTVALKNAKSTKTASTRPITAQPMAKLQRATHLSAHRHHWHHKNSFASCNKKSFTEDAAANVNNDQNSTGTSAFLVLGNSKSIGSRKKQNIIQSEKYNDDQQQHQHQNQHHKRQESSENDLRLDSTTRKWLNLDIIEPNSDDQVNTTTDGKPGMTVVDNKSLKNPLVPTADSITAEELEEIRKHQSLLASIDSTAPLGNPFTLNETPFAGHSTVEKDNTQNHTALVIIKPSLPISKFTENTLAGKSQSATSQSGKSQARKPQVEKHQAEKPQSGKPQSGNSQAGKPQFKKPQESKEPTKEVDCSYGDGGGGYNQKTVSSNEDSRSSTNNPHLFRLEGPPDGQPNVTSTILASPKGKDSGSRRSRPISNLSVEKQPQQQYTVLPLTSLHPIDDVDPYIEKLPFSTSNQQRSNGRFYSHYAYNIAPQTVGSSEGRRSYRSFNKVQLRSDNIKIHAIQKSHQELPLQRVPSGKQLHRRNTSSVDLSAGACYFDKNQQNGLQSRVNMAQSLKKSITREGKRSPVNKNAMLSRQSSKSSTKRSKVQSKQASRQLQRGGGNDSKSTNQSRVLLKDNNSRETDSHHFIGGFSREVISRESVGDAGSNEDDFLKTQLWVDDKADGLVNICYEDGTPVKMLDQAAYYNQIYLQRSSVDQEQEEDNLAGGGIDILNDVNLPAPPAALPTALFFGKGSAVNGTFHKGVEASYVSENSRQDRSVDHRVQQQDEKQENQLSRNQLKSSSSTDSAQRLKGVAKSVKKLQRPVSSIVRRSGMQLGQDEGVNYDRFAFNLIVNNQGTTSSSSSKRSQTKGGMLRKASTGSLNKSTCKNSQKNLDNKEIRVYSKAITLNQRDSGKVKLLGDQGQMLQYTTYSDYSVNNRDGATRNTYVAGSLLKNKKATKKYMTLNDDKTDTMRNSHRNGNDECYQIMMGNSSDQAANTVQKSLNSTEGLYPEQLINLVQVSPPKIIQALKKNGGVYDSIVTPKYPSSLNNSASQDGQQKGERGAPAHNRNQKDRQMAVMYSQHVVGQPQMFTEFSRGAHGNLCRDRPKTQLQPHPDLRLKVTVIQSSLRQSRQASAGTGSLLSIGHSSSNRPLGFHQLRRRPLKSKKKQLSQKRIAKLKKKGKWTTELPPGEMLDSTIKMACESPLEAGTSSGSGSSSSSSCNGEEQKANEIMHSYIRSSMNISNKKAKTTKNQKQKRQVLQSALPHSKKQQHKDQLYLPTWSSNTEEDSPTRVSSKVLRASDGLISMPASNHIREYSAQQKNDSRAVNSQGQRRQGHNPTSMQQKRQSHQIKKSMNQLRKTVKSNYRYSTVTAEPQPGQSNISSLSLRPVSVMNQSMISISPADEVYPVLRRPHNVQHRGQSQDLDPVSSTTVLRGGYFTKNKRGKAAQSGQANVANLNVYKDEPLSLQQSPQRGVVRQGSETTSMHSLKINNLSMDSSLQIESLKQEHRLKQSIMSQQIKGGGMTKSGGFRRPTSSSFYQVKRTGLGRLQARNVDRKANADLPESHPIQPQSEYAFITSSYGHNQSVVTQECLDKGLSAQQSKRFQASSDHTHGLSLLELARLEEPR